MPARARWVAHFNSVGKSLAAAGAMLGFFFSLVAPLYSVEVRPAWYATGFDTGVGDFYQHQGYTGAGTWEINAGKRGGWCAPVSFLDVLFDFQQQGYNNLLPAAITAPATWLATADTVIPDLAQNALAYNTDRFQTYINSKGYGSATPTPLLVNNVSVAGNGTVTYKTPAPRVLPANPGVPVAMVDTTVSALSFTDIKLRAGDDLLYRIGAGAAAPAPWWQPSYHSMAVSGINIGNQTVFLADPDSNKGSTGADSGWPTPIPAGRKYVAADPLPFPAAPNLANPATYEQYYAGFQINNGANANNDKITGVGGNAPRYTNTILNYINDIAPQHTGILFDGIGPPAGDKQTTVAVQTTKPIDKIYFLPSSPIGSLGLDTLTSVGDVWTAATVTTDPYGNGLYDGGVLYSLQSGDGITPADIGGADLTIGTANSFSSTGYEVLFHYADTPSFEWDTEIVGQPSYSNETPAEPQQFVPEPASLSILIIGAIVCRCGRRRKG